MGKYLQSSEGMGKVVIVAEKPDIGTRLAATLGGCFIDGVELRPEMLGNKNWQAVIKRERSEKGCLRCSKNSKEIVVTWAFGHIAELKQAKEYDKKYAKWSEKLFPFIPASFEIKLKENGGTQKQFRLIKSLLTARDTEYIVNAMDADREGELIFDYIYRLSGSNKPCRRLWISSFTEEAVLKSFKNLKQAQEVKSLASAGRCRAIADWLVGTNLTVLATLKYGGFNNIISIGRVQTPTLAMLVKRELEIVNFTPEAYYELWAVFETPKGELFKGKWKGRETDRFKDKAGALELLYKVEGQRGLVTNVEQSQTKEPPPLLYDLTVLQGDANAKFSFSAKKTLDIAQRLYEKQFITYPRTNSRFLTRDLKGEIPRLIKALPQEYNPFRDNLLSNPLPMGKRVFDDSRVGSHTAILTTYKSPTGLSQEERKVYDLVAKSLLKTFMPPAVWAQSKAQVEVQGEVFLSSGRVLIEPGWRAVDGNPGANKQEEDSPLPMLSKGDTVQGKKYEVLAKETKPPRRYTEKSLLSAMETAGRQVEDEEMREAMKEHGIGTPATRAAIIERLLEVKYINREGKNLVPTPKGIEVIQNLPIEEIKSPALTGEWEFKLNQVEKNELEGTLFIKEIGEFTLTTANFLKGQARIEIKQAAESLGTCPNCGSPIIRTSKGFGCTAWKDGCKFHIFSPVAGKKLSDTAVKQLLRKGETQKLKGFKSKSGKGFAAALELIQGENGKVRFKF